MKCEIIRDLLPLYCDELCSQESRQEIETHLGQCKACQGYLEEMRGESVPAPSAPDAEVEAKVLRGVKRKFSRRRRRSILIAVAVMLVFSVALVGAADVERPVPYTDGLVTAELAVDEVIDLYYHGGSYNTFYGFSRELDGRNAVFLYFDETIVSGIKPRGEGHLSIGNALLTDYETATYQVSREVDAVYYLVGDYVTLPDLDQEAFEQAAADAVLLWER